MVMWKLMFGPEELANIENLCFLTVIYGEAADL